ncbi:hypothetical protein ACTG9Q_13000 [Actinokineospora sp. 24-640]
MHTLHVVDGPLVAPIEEIVAENVVMGVDVPVVRSMVDSDTPPSVQVASSGPLASSGTANAVVVSGGAGSVVDWGWGTLLGGEDAAGSPQPASTAINAVVVTQDEKARNDMFAPVTLGSHHDGLDRVIAGFDPALQAWGDRLLPRRREVSAELWADRLNEWVRHDPVSGLVGLLVIIRCSGA